MFETVDNKYRPIPFWSWNEKLDSRRTSEQIEMMEQAGIGGYFMHARGGLETEYMGKEWFDNISVGIEEANKRNMGAWAYDENGWPSGFGNGIVNGAGVEFQQKYLRYEPGEKRTSETICNYDGKHFYYEVNPYYVDTLDEKVIKRFLDEIYEPYYKKYKNEFEGFFTDEPQISRNGIPWSFILPDEYKKAYGDDLLEHLAELFEPIADYKTTRVRFWKLVTDLFSKNCMKQIYDWCESHGLKLTGHLVLEETLKDQLTPNGAVMPHYEYFHIPGMDWLGRPIFNCLTLLQLSSVAHQLGKEQVLSETFALCGHNVSHNELKGIFEWQMVHGITQLCQHLEGYSLRGIRKRDYPPALFYQQPWWDEYKVFNDAMSRVGMMLARGEVCYDTLLIHPQTTAWAYFDNDRNEGLKELNQQFLNTVDKLEKKHILFHLGDETIMERHAKVVGDTLIIGNQKYKTVIMPEAEVFFDSTKKLLSEFKKNGGRIVTESDIVENNIIDCPDITYTKRIFDDFDMYYFVNSTRESHNAKISAGNKLMDIKTGEILPFDGEKTFRPFESIVVIDDKTDKKDALVSSVDMNVIDIGGEWKIVEKTLNSITLDRCDYYFDGKLIEKDGYVLNIQQRACNEKRPIQLRCEYKVMAEYIPEEIYLAVETPEIFDIKINNTTINKNVCGYFVDSEFKKLDISKYLELGQNTIVFETEYKQSERVYENLVKAAAFESEKNKLTYDMEVEPIYLVGDFSVSCDGNFEELDRSAYRYKGSFKISKPTEKIALKNIEQQGFPFFAGSITVEKEVELLDGNYILSFEPLGINVVSASINGKKLSTFMWEPYEADISEYIKPGKNTIVLTLTNNLRNLMGPHHLEEGESYLVTPIKFYKEPCVWNAYVENKGFRDDYCFVETSLK